MADQVAARARPSTKSKPRLRPALQPVYLTDDERDLNLRALLFVQNECRRCLQRSSVEPVEAFAMEHSAARLDTLIAKLSPEATDA